MTGRRLALAAIVLVLSGPLVAHAQARAGDPRAAAAYALVDLETGRTLRSQRPAIIATRVAPGSIAKIATMAAAIDAGVLAGSTRIACTRAVRLADGRTVPCAHAPVVAPLDAVTALAESCNVFFASLGGRLSVAQLSAAHVRFGLDPVGPDDDRMAAAIGLGRGRALPRRLLEGLRRAVDGAPLLREGLARAADDGTASALGRAGLQAYAKTGTSAMPGGRSLGLVVAVAPRARPTRGLVVLLPGGTGGQSADVAAAVLSEALGERPREEGGGAGAPSSERPASAVVRIGTPEHEGRRYRVEAVDLESYVAQVVTGETPATTPVAARQAVSIAARTFALANRERHRADGFDLCTLTHCQVTRPADPGARAVAAATLGRVLTERGRTAPRPAAVFYSAACGGTLDDVAAVAGTGLAGTGVGTRDLPWMRARPDPAGVEEPAWTSTLDAAQLDRALRASGWKGSGLRGLRLETAASGRVRRIWLDGLEPRATPIADFRRVVGQRLGWQLVKSTAFTMVRTARGFTLSGRGSGHGVGLCVLGAAALAGRGWDADRILATYFDGLDVTRLGAEPVLTLRVPADAQSEAPSLRRLIARHLAALALALDAPRPAQLTVVMHPTVESYQRETGLPWWTTGATRTASGTKRIDTLSPAVLRRQGQLETTLRHELIHVLIDDRLQGEPLWRREGLALQHSGARLDPLDGPCPTDAELQRPATRAGLSRAYRRALGCVLRSPPSASDRG